MKQVVRYQSDDGTIWLTEGEALKRDSLRAKIKEGLSWLKSCNESSFEGYYQQSLLQVSKVRILAIELSREEYKSDVWDVAPEKIDPGMAMRYLPDYCPINDLWSRLQCIDDKGREWEQPYYVNHPDKTTMVKLG